jgi:hypothetical protein
LENTTHRAGDEEAMVVREGAPTRRAAPAEAAGDEARGDPARAEDERTADAHTGVAALALLVLLLRVAAAREGCDASIAVLLLLGGVGCVKRREGGAKKTRRWGSVELSVLCVNRSGDRSIGVRRARVRVEPGEAEVAGGGGSIKLGPRTKRARRATEGRRRRRRRRRRRFLTRTLFRGGESRNT